MAFVKMLWAEKTYDFNIDVKPSINNTGGGQSTFNVKVEPSIQNTGGGNMDFTIHVEPSIRNSP